MERRRETSREEQIATLTISKVKSSPVTVGLLIGFGSMLIVIVGLTTATYTKMDETAQAAVKMHVDKSLRTSHPEIKEIYPTRLELQTWQNKIDAKLNNIKLQQDNILKRLDGRWQRRSRRR